MYEIKKSAKFEAAHQIVGHTDPITGEPGKCSRLHGHSYKIAVCIRSQSLLEIGFIVDFYWVGDILKKLAEEFDHNNLNTHLLFTSNHLNTTAENIAFIVYNTVGRTLQKLVNKSEAAPGAFVYYAECCETEGTATRYYNPTLNLSNDIPETE